MPSMSKGRAWYAQWFASREFMVMTASQVKDAKSYFRFTPVVAYPKGVEVIDGEVGYLPIQGVRVLRKERVH